MDVTGYAYAAAGGIGGAGPLALPPAMAPSDQLLRLKDLQRSFQAQHQYQPTAPAEPGARQGGLPLDAGSLIPPPYPSSPHDSLAPALRADKPVTSSGTEQGSLPCGGGAVEARHGADDVPALPDNFPDFFGELNVPSLEELVQDVVTAEAELVSVNKVIVKATELVRSQTLSPVPTEAPRGAASAPAASMGLPSYGSMSVEGAQRGARRAAPRTTSAGAAVGAKRKSPDPAPVAAPSASFQQQTPAQTAAAARPTVHFAALPDSPFQHAQHGMTPPPMAAAAEPRYMSAPAPGLGTAAGAAGRFPSPALAAATPRFESLPDDQALLDQMSHLPRLAATPPSAPLPRPVGGLSKAASVPAAAPWLSPAAAIHAATASRPGDREVLDWLLFGK